ncbi:MAG TPA: response regulator transcription factor [Candidatus Saccharimonadia bacterium]|nr:response regulator transcription factor [Candidatus Saccharimonadia bacterium]
MSNPRIRIALADDQELVREGIKSLLALSGKVDVVLEAANGQAVLDTIAGAGVDVLVMDIRMPVRDGIETLRELRRGGSALPVVMLTTFAESDLFEQAVAAGAQGFLRKDASPEALIAAIQAVHAGGTALTPVAAESVRAGLAGSDTRPAGAPITEREASILKLMAGGYSNKEIARSLHLAEGTVKNYVSDILVKLESRDRTHAVLRAISLRVI